MRKPSHRGNRPLFRNRHPHAPHNFAGVLRWKLGLAPEKPALLAPRLHPRPRHPQTGLPKTCPAPQPQSLRAYWIGHSTFLLQHQNLNFLTDPIFGNCQPVPVGRMRRSAPPGIRLEDLPPIHHVLISHCHYDHLDEPAVRALIRLHPGIHFWLPEGLSSWFHRRRIYACTELPWGQSAQLTHSLELHCVPAQHGAARTLFDRNRTHWCGWVLRSPLRSAYFAGDTGYAPIFREIGQTFGGFDLALIPIGCYNPRWLMHPVHIDPAEAVQVHLDVQSRQSIACHWGTFRLADEPLTEPPALLDLELAKAGIDPAKFLAMLPGDSIDL